MWCDYCLNYHADTKKVYRYEIEEQQTYAPIALAKIRWKHATVAIQPPMMAINIVQIVTNK